MVGSLVGVPEQPVGLNLICSTINGGCMGLPQELVDHIVDTLHEDLPALKACSLTCKAMFASTRHLIHQTLCLTPRNNERVLTREEEEKLRRLKQGYQDVQLRFLSYAGERGLLQYTRKIYISRCFRRVAIPAGAFTPDTLLPHIHHFRSLDRVHAITIEWYMLKRGKGISNATSLISIPPSHLSPFVSLLVTIKVFYNLLYSSQISKTCPLSGRMVKDDPHALRPPPRLLTELHLSAGASDSPISTMRRGLGRRWNSPMNSETGSISDPSNWTALPGVVDSAC